MRLDLSAAGEHASAMPARSTAGALAENDQRRLAQNGERRRVVDGERRGVGAGGRRDHQHHAQEHRPHGHAIRTKPGPLVTLDVPMASGHRRTSAVPRRISLSALTSDGDRAAAGNAGPLVRREVVRASPSSRVCLIADLTPGHCDAWSRHFTVLFRGHAGLADGLASKERRYAQGAISPNNLGPPLPLARPAAGRIGNSAVRVGDAISGLGRRRGRTPKRSQ